MVARYGDKIKMMNLKRQKNFKKKQTIRIINFLPLNVPVEYTIRNKYTKTKGLHHASKYLICNDSGSFNDKFHH